MVSMATLLRKARRVTIPLQLRPVPRLQPSHIWNVVCHLPQEQRIELHALVLFAARASEALWQA